MWQGCWCLSAQPAERREADVAAPQSLWCFGKEWTLEFDSGLVVVFLYILASQFNATIPCW